MSNVAIDLTKTVKEIITTMKTAIDNLNTDVSSNKTAIDNLKEQIFQAVYPVGSVYVSITDSRNPANILGFGTWEALPAGYGLVAQGTATAEDGSTLTFTAGQKSGEFKHQITVGELPEVSGAVKNYILWGDDRAESGVLHSSVGAKMPVASFGSENVYRAEVSISLGNNQRHNNISPGIAVYGWHRIS